MKRWDIVNRFVSSIAPLPYLEIGVRGGSTFWRISAPTRIGVDPEPVGRRLRALAAATAARRVLRVRTGTQLFTMESDRFFETQASWLGRRPFGVAFVDGLHTYAQSLRDIENCLRFLDPNGTVVVHDCSPDSASVAAPAEDVARAMPGFDGRWSGEVYKAIINLRATRPDVEVYVLDCDSGVGIVRKRRSSDTLRLSTAEIDGLTYDDLAQNRSVLLDLRPAGDLSEIVVG